MYYMLPAECEIRKSRCPRDNTNTKFFNNTPSQKNPVNTDLQVCAILTAQSQNRKFWSLQWQAQPLNAGSFGVLLVRHSRSLSCSACLCLVRSRKCSHSCASLTIFCRQQNKEKKKKICVQCLLEIGKKKKKKDYRWAVNTEYIFTLYKSNTIQ